MDIIGRRRAFLVASGILVAICVIALSTRGLNLGVDFTGGSLIRFRFERPVTGPEVRGTLASAGLADLDLARAIVQPIKGTNDVQVKAQVKGKPLSDEQAGRVAEVLGSRLGAVSIVESEAVEPVIGRELLTQALTALVIASIGIVIYVTLRFEFRFAVAAIAALVWAVAVLLGVFALLGRQVNSPFVAAVLTIIGYSINNTIVIFDKIRENLRLRKKETLEELTNRSILQTMRRSLFTTVTTLLGVIALYLFGGVTIRNFNLALMVGLIAGAYSSIFVAPPLWLEWRLADRARQQRRAAAAKMKPGAAKAK